jgi:hypothetical protein
LWFKGLQARGYEPGFSGGRAVGGASERRPRNRLVRNGLQLVCAVGVRRATRGRDCNTGHCGRRIAPDLGQLIARYLSVTPKLRNGAWSALSAIKPLTPVRELPDAYHWQIATRVCGHLLACRIPVIHDRRVWVRIQPPAKVLATRVRVAWESHNLFL